MGVRARPSGVPARTGSGSATRRRAGRGAGSGARGRSRRLGLAEDAAPGSVRALDVLDAPRRPERPRRSSAVGAPGPRSAEASPALGRAGAPPTSCLRLASIRSLSSLPTLKNGVRLAGMCTSSPVFGFRPSRASRTFTWKLPKPRISIRSPVAERLGHRIEDRVDHDLGVLLRDVRRLLGHPLDQPALRHRIPPPVCLTYSWLRLAARASPAQRESPERRRLALRLLRGHAPSASRAPRGP